MSQENSKSNSTLPKGCGCLVLLMCIGVMGAIPSFLNMVDRTPRSEAKHYVASMNRAQQAKFARSGAFSTSIEALELGIKTETNNYKYSLRVINKDAFNYAVSKQKTEKSYVGGVFLVSPEPKVSVYDMTPTAILCEADSSGTIKPAEPTEQNGKLICGKGTTEVPVVP